MSRVALSRNACPIPTVDNHFLANASLHTAVLGGVHYIFFIVLVMVFYGCYTNMAAQPSATFLDIL